MGLITLSLIKADIGSICGHVKPAQVIINAVEKHVAENAESIGVINFRITHTGDDIAILFSHKTEVGGKNNQIHKLAWDAFMAGTKIAKIIGAYGAGQDLLAESFAGNIRGMGPAIAEMSFEEREAEQFIVFAADKCGPGAYSFALYEMIANCPGLMLSPSLSQGFSFTIMDVAHTDADKVITLNYPEEAVKITALLRDENRFIVESIHSRTTGEIVAINSTTRLHNIAGKYVGKDDPVMIVRTQKDFPATGEIIEPFKVCPFVTGFMRGSHVGPFTPVPQNSGISYFDGPPVVSAAGYSMKGGVFTEAVDLFDDKPGFWTEIRRKSALKAQLLREQKWFSVAMASTDEIEYTGVMKLLKELELKFRTRS